MVAFEDIRDTEQLPSLISFDLWLSDGEFFLRLVELAPSSPSPTLNVDFSKLQATSERLVILSEDYIVVDDPDTLLDDGRLDALNIKLRISGISDDVLQRRADVSSPWTSIPLTGVTQYREFSLADMRNGLIAFLPGSGAYTLTFQIQVADAGDPATPGSPSNLSDSDPQTTGAQPANVSIPVVALKEVEGGQKGAINDESPRGAITPDDTTLGAWMNEDSTLRILVKLTGGKTGLVLMNGKIVRLREFLSLGTHSVATTEITTSWDSSTNTLLLQGTSSATVSDFQDVLDALELHTVRSGTESYRTISVRPDLSATVSEKNYLVSVRSDLSATVPKKDYFVRDVKVDASPSQPILEVRLGGLQATSKRPRILSEDYIVVDDTDTRLDDGRLDASNIKLRISGIPNGVLQRRTDVSSPWMAIPLTGTGGTQYREFSLADMRNGLIALLPASGAYTLTFQMQAVDGGDPTNPGSPSNLSDSDPQTTGAQAANVSISVVTLKEVEAGQKVALSDDGALTPDADTLQAWLDADSTLQIFVELQGGKSGIVVPEEGVVGEVLFLSGGVSNITVIWDAVNNRLFLQGNTSATVGNFEAALGALQLQTVRFKEDSYRTISVRPDIFIDVPRKDFYAREVKVGASPREPLLSVRGFTRILATAEQPLILTQDHISVDDVDTVLGDGSNEDPVRIKFRITGLSGGVLQRRTFDTQHKWVEIPLVGSAGSKYQEFSLFELRNGLVSFLADSSEPTLDFHIQAADDDGNLSDSDLGDDNPDPISVSIPVVVPKEIVAGKEMLVNNDNTVSGDGLLTPDDVTLGAWITASNRLRVLVTLHDRRLGEELFLQDNHGITTITSSWSWEADIGTLSLRSNGSATPDDFQAVLNALKLRTARSAEAGFRTLSVRPDVQVAVAKRDDYTRVLLVQASGLAPYVGEQENLQQGVQESRLLKFGQDDRATLLPSEFRVEDFDTPPSDVTIVMRGLTAGVTPQKSDGSGGYASITSESDGSYEFTLKELQKGLIALYLSSPVGQAITFTLEAKDTDGNWNDVGKGSTHERGERLFSLMGVLPLSPEELETDLETGHQRAIPFSSGLEQLIETARSNSTRDGVLRIALVNAVSGDRLLTKSATGLVGSWSDRGHLYTFTVSDGNTTSADIETAIAQIYYRASESVGGKERVLVVSWVDNTSAEAVLFTARLANRPPVLRNWGIAARYHDITPAPDATETPLDLGYHPFWEYMPDILDNEGKVVRLEVILVDKAGGMLSSDERVFLGYRLQDRLRAQGLVLRELRSSDQKARALVIEAADGKTPVSPEFMSQVLQGLLYRHDADGTDGDVGERRLVSVVVFDGQAYSQALEMEVRLVDKTPDPAKYVNTFIGTAKQKRMGVAGLSGNIAGMTFPGASYPFGMIKFSPDSEGSAGRGGSRTGFLQNGGYRRDARTGDLRFGLQYLSGPGCAVAGVGQFKVGVSGRGPSDDWSTSDESSAPGYYQVGVKDQASGPAVSRINVELATGTARTGMMRLTYEAAATGGWIDYNYGARESVYFSTIRSLDDEWIVQYESFGMGICDFGWRRASERGYWMRVSFHIKKDGLRNLGFWGNRLYFNFDGDNREVLGRCRCRISARATPARIWRPKLPVGISRHTKSRVAKPGITICRKLPSTTSMTRITTRAR